MNTETTPRQRALTLQDRSRYFLGLLLLTASDRVLLPQEKCRLRDIAGLLDFSSSFCEDAIENVLYNQLILDKPVKFSSISVAKAFLHDALQLAHADGELVQAEWEWLESVALINKIPIQWMIAENQAIQQNSDRDSWAAETWWPGAEKMAEFLTQN